MNINQANKKAKEKMDSFITDGGIIANQQAKQSRLFVTLCYILTGALIVMGLIAYINP
ncbi:MAG: hypothetical protein K6E48_09105 [Lachnospiraceae bacterium]|nr:hypothetical protein [Lachnospiraceae bacterium]